MSVTAGSEIGEVRRQREDWQRDATRDLATGQDRRCHPCL